METAKRSKVLDLFLLMRMVRWYNIGLIVIAQYLVACFVFYNKSSLQILLYDYKLHLLVAANAFAVAGAFIINGFYDVDKDLVNNPRSVIFQKFLGQNVLLNVYAALNVCSILLAGLASWHIFIYFASLVLGFWFYSHKLQKIAFVREVSAALLAISGIVAVWLYFNEMHLGFLLYVGSLTVLLFTREVVKDLMGNRGNAIFGYQTLVIVQGESQAKRGLMLVNMLLCLGFVIGFFIWVKAMGYFSGISAFSLIVAMVLSIACYASKNREFYRVADSLLKMAIVVHVLSLFYLGLV